MVGGCLKIGPVSTDSRHIIGISTPGNSICRSYCGIRKITGNHSKACWTASATGNRTSAVWNVSIVCLKIMRDLHSVCRIAATAVGNLIIAKDMLHILFVSITVIRPAWSGTHHVRIGDGVFFGISTVPFHSPVNVTGSVIVALECELDSV